MKEDKRMGLVKTIVQLQCHMSQLWPLVPKAAPKKEPEAVIKEKKPFREIKEMRQKIPVWNTVKETVSLRIFRCEAGERYS